ncbi:UDP-N-acetylmuramyl pentapeptide phosphotransferase/UDP-N-acetylglucosamine-1-phosphate transferase [Xylanibacter ruminicola]|uniref:UDP-N-acetylmuramyl pentapeptide phosphotransferase/UDP-N-acetylglucosamine-1-phosphate transferase n=1 Tax=Xylanibacter ruminicola TaxID=839 RepID=A0A1H5W9V4_XYLRU|nr:MraY family glycosyltransferase [Xylanibacter ruminicola]SEF96252.1 UDP-N-acetylmuramyl pentapeptide phosphotransferase/UDP-N-acetylglucosamine-1-phosphate transferase [Xylanibacter ruminicola]
MLYLSLFVPLLLSIGLAMYIIPRILVVSVKKDLNLPPRYTDKGHRNVPRLGGVSLFPILVISVGLAAVSCLMFDWRTLLSGEDEDTFVQFTFAIAGLTTMYLLGVMDDLIGVSLVSKMVIEFLASLLIPLSGLWLDDLHGLLGIYELPYWIGLFGTVMTVMFITNAIPMLDDVDGLASGMAMIAFSVLGALSLIADMPFLLMICSAMVGMLFPFFFRNVMGWRIGWRNIYLGDTGGLTIGYMLSFVVIALSRQGGYTLPEGIIMVCFGTLLIPMFDVLRVAVMRTVNHRSVFSRDNNHIHHRLMMGGMGPFNVLITILLVSAFFIVLNVVGVWLDWNLSLLLVGNVACWLVLQVVISYFKNKNRDSWVEQEWMI